MLPQRDLKEVIMRRVRAIFIFRSLVVPAALEVGFVSALVVVVVGFVSVGDVLTNLKQTGSLGSLFTYTYEAVVHTELYVQLGMVFSLAASGYFVYRLIKTFRSASFRGDIVRA